MTALPSPPVLALIALSLACVSEEGPGFEVPETPDYPNITFFQASGAGSSTERAREYTIFNTLDGSGLPEGFGPTDEHADYAPGNHWTTADGDTAGALALYSFEDTVSMDTLYIWHHRSTSPPADSENYAITRFDIRFLDINNESIVVLEDLRGEPGLA